MSDLSPIINLDYEASETPIQKIHVAKASSRGIIPDRRAQLLRRIDNAKSEVGRLDKLLDYIRSDVLHLTTD